MKTKTYNLKKSIMTIISIMLVLIIVTSSLCSCSNQISNPKTNSDTEKKVLNIATIGESNTLFPVQMVPQNYMFSKLVFDTIVTYENGEVKPVLAESWKIETKEDKTTTITLKIRDKVKFHDGTICDANAIKVNLEKWHNDQNYSALPAVTTWQTCTTTDNNEVVLTYANPYYAYMTDFCWPDVCVIAAPSEVEKAYDNDDSTIPIAIGTGPYSYGEYVAGVQTTFNKFEDYWNSKPAYDKIVAKYIPDANSRIKALKTGEVDLLYGSSELNYDDFNIAKELDNMKGSVSDIPSVYRNITLNFNGVLSDIEVRKAIALAIDKDAISNGIFSGYEPKANTVMTEGGLFIDDCKDIVDIYASKYKFNAAEAKKTLENAGYKLNENGIYQKGDTILNIKCTIPSGDESINLMSVAIQTMLKKVGINMTIEPIETVKWMMSFYNPNAFDLTFQKTHYSYAVPSCWYNAIKYMAQTTSICTLDQCFSATPKEGWEDFFAYIDEAAHTDNNERLVEIYRYLLNKDLNEFLDIPLTQQKEVIVFNTKKIADYNYTNDFQFFNVLNITPAK